MRIRPWYDFGKQEDASRIVELLGQCIANEETPAEFKEAAQAWLDGMNDAEASKAAAATLKPMIEGYPRS